MKKHWLVISLFVLMSVTIYAAVGVIIFFGNKNNVDAAGKSVATMSSYTVSFNTLGGSSVASQRVASGDTAEEPNAPTRRCSIFKYWFIKDRDGNEQQFDFTTRITSNVTLYAKWEIEKYIVTFDDGLNEKPTEREVIVNYNATFEPVTWHDYYTVLGWYTDRELNHQFDFDNTPITSDITLYAKWPLEFEHNANNTYSIVDYTDNGLTQVVIPATYRGKPVTTIGDHVFKDCTSIEQVTIQDGITIIDDNAFEGCAALTTVSLPASLTSIGQSVFADCTSLNSVVIPRNVTSMGKYVFAYCNALTQINCQANARPVNWNTKWISRCNATVQWGY